MQSQLTAHGLEDTNAAVTVDAAAAVRRLQDKDGSWAPDAHGIAFALLAHKTRPEEVDWKDKTGDNMVNVASLLAGGDGDEGEHITGRVSSAGRRMSTTLARTMTARFGAASFNSATGGEAAVSADVTSALNNKEDCPLIGA